jgi:hypothetical protein
LGVSATSVADALARRQALDENELPLFEEQSAAMLTDLKYLAAKEARALRKKRPTSG